MPGNAAYWTKKSTQLQSDDPTFAPKMLKVVETIIKKKKDLKLTQIPEEAVQLFCKEFPNESIVHNYVEGKRNARGLVTTAIRNMIKALDMGDYLEVFGITDSFIFANLKQIVEQKDNLTAAKGALDTLLKLKHYLVDGRMNAPTQNTQINIKEATFYKSGARTKKEAMSDLLENYEELKKINEFRKDNPHAD